MDRHDVDKKNAEYDRFLRGEITQKEFDRMYPPNYYATPELPIDVGADDREIEIGVRTPISTDPTWNPNQVGNITAIVVVTLFVLLIAYKFLVYFGG